MRSHLKCSAWPSQLQSRPSSLCPEQSSGTERERATVRREDKRSEEKALRKRRVIKSWLPQLQTNTRAPSHAVIAVLSRLCLTSTLLNPYISYHLHSWCMHLALSALDVSLLRGRRSLLVPKKARIERRKMRSNETYQLPLLLFLFYMLFRHPSFLSSNLFAWRKGVKLVYADTCTGDSDCGRRRTSSNCQVQYVLF